MSKSPPQPSSAPHKPSPREIAIALAKKLGDYVDLPTDTSSVIEYSPQSSDDEQLSQIECEEFRLYSLNKPAARAKSAISKALYPQGLPSDAHITMSSCREIPNTRLHAVPRSCLLESARILEAQWLKRMEDKGRHPGRPFYKRVVERHYLPMNPDPRNIHKKVTFGPSDPCPRSLGVALRDIMKRDEIYMIDAADSVITFVKFPKRINIFIKSLILPASPQKV
ncbi:hypothetical protein H0H81_006906 [Sphagnurus paluster]|uniref:Uncharacterized protein n=1 Tax=Sphagnurus paluster TaxID=117069 RepID=A0A9P7GR21_9AGAR|nr:hypothetical protein H0H81_006906 [Sphagnurus paluster]